LKWLTSPQAVGYLAVQDAVFQARKYYKAEQYGNILGSLEKALETMEKLGDRAGCVDVLEAIAGAQRHYYNEDNYSYSYLVSSSYCCQSAPDNRKVAGGSAITPK